MLFTKREGIELRIDSEASSGGSGTALSPDALWWGWNWASSSTEPLPQPLSPKAGAEVGPFETHHAGKRGSRQGPKNTRGKS